MTEDSQKDRRKLIMCGEGKKRKKKGVTSCLARNRQQKAEARDTHQKQVSWNRITPKQEDFNTSMVVLKSVSVVLEVAFNEMASGKVKKRDGSKEGVHDYDRRSQDRERHQD
nr:hypothetical protein [Tanacetum cinerariifolium]